MHKLLRMLILIRIKNISYLSRLWHVLMARHWLQMIIKTPGSMYNQSIPLCSGAALVWPSAGGGHYLTALGMILTAAPLAQRVPLRPNGWHSEAGPGVAPWNARPGTSVEG